MKNFLVLFLSMILIGCSGGLSAPPAPVPSIPTGVTVTGGNGQVILSWTAVTDALAYNVYYGTAAGVTTASGTKITGATSGNVISGLTNGTPYYFVVTVVNAYGESSVSSKVSATPQITAPTGVTVTGSNAQTDLSWTAVPNAASYNVYYGTAAGVTTASGTKITGVTSGHAITGLTNGATYYFVMTAVNTVGTESPVSNEVSATPHLSASSLWVTYPGNGQVSLGWSAVPNATSYNVYYGTAAGVTTASGTKITGVTSGNAITGLTNGTLYYFVVTAVNAGNESLVSNEVSATPQLSTSSLWVTSPGNGSVSLGWSAVSNATSYNVYYGTTAGVTTSSGTKITGATSGNAITGLANGTLYYFVVTAVSAGNESPVSNEVSATPHLPAPTGVTITGGDTQVAPSWSAVPNATSYNVYYGTAAGVTTASGTKISGAVSSSAITGLTNGTTYYFVATAASTGDESPVSSEVSATPQFPGMTNPSTGTATNIADVSATLNGSFNNPSGYTTTAWVEWGMTTPYGNSTPALSRLSYSYKGNINPSFNVSSLTVGTTYHYRFCTQNTNVTWCGNDAMFTTVAMKAQTTIVSALTYPVQFVVDANNIYWTEGGATGSVKQKPLTGVIVTTLASGLNDPYGIAVDATNVYWTEQGSGTVKRVPIGGGAITTLFTSPASPNFTPPQFITVDATSVYFTLFGTYNTSASMRNADGTVNKMPIGGGPVVQLAQGLNGPQTIKVDATNVYWTEVANFISGAGTIKQVPINGGAVTPLVSSLSGSQYIAIDTTSSINATNLYYWSGYGTMAAVPIGVTPANPVEITSGMNGTPPLVVDLTGIYWTESSNGGTVKKLNKAGWNVMILTSGLSNPQWIAWYATGIYWLEGDTFNGTTQLWAGKGAIKKIQK